MKRISCTVNGKSRPPRDWLDFDTDDPRYFDWLDRDRVVSREQYSALRESIRSGTWTGRIVTDEIGRILDGHEAYKAFQAEKIRPRGILVCKVGHLSREEILRLKRLWHLCNLRHLTRDDMDRLIRDHLKDTPDWSDHRIGRCLGCDHKTVGARRRELLETGEIPQFDNRGGRGKTKGLPMAVAANRTAARKMGQLLQKTDAKGGTIGPRGLKRGRYLRERKKMAAEGRKLACPENISLIHGDFQTLEIAPGSVDLIWTDPPWALATTDLYPTFARLALDWLKPGGLLGVYPGTFLKDLANDVLRQHFGKVWELISLYKDSHAARSIGGFSSTYQPILLFSRGEPTHKFMMADSVSSGQIEKRYHKWERNLDETLHLLRNLTRPGQIVVDPFGGGFTTADACLRLGLRCLSCDTEEECVSVGRYRLAQTWEEMQAKP